MPGKYSHLKSQLTKFSGETEYQDRVNAKKEDIKNFLLSEGNSLKPSSFADVLIRARLEKARLEQLVKDENLIIAAMDQILVEQLEGDNYASLKLDNGVSLTIKDDVYCQVENKELFHVWISETNNEDLLTVNYQTMSSLVKKNLLDGEEIPKGIATYFKQSIAIRGLKGLSNE